MPVGASGKFLGMLLIYSIHHPDNAKDINEIYIQLIPLLEISLRYHSALCSMSFPYGDKHVTYEWYYFFNSLISPSAAYMRQWIGSALVEVKAFRIFGAKPLSQPMLCYC